MFEAKEGDLRKCQLVLYSKRGCELLEKMCYKRRLKDHTKEAVSNGNSREILNWRYSKTKL